MLFRSTGLGKSELIGEITEIKRQGDYLIMEVQTLEPVRWKIRGGLNRKDLRMVLKQLLKASILPYLLSPSGWFKQAAHPGEF